MRSAGRNGASEFLLITAATLMYFLIQVFPLILTLFVGFELRVTLGKLKAHLFSYRDNISKKQGIDPLVLVFGKHSHEEKIDDFGMFEINCLQQMIPTEGKKLSFGLLQGSRE